MISKLIIRKLAVILLLAISGAAAFATLGDGKKKSGSSKNLLTSERTTKPGIFSLRSGYTYRGSEIINSQSERKYINLNTVVTSQKGNITYIVPLKKKVILVKLDIGNRQLRRN